jgi:transcriptional regulator GlxA family with amidase domain
MSGLQIVASHSYREVVDGLDTLVVVGGSGCEAAIKDSMLIDWVRSIAPRTRRIVSICTGAAVLAEAGLLDRRRATTHWVYADQLAKAYPSIEVDASRIFVRDGNVYTSGGLQPASTSRVWEGEAFTSGCQRTSDMDAGSS